MDNHSLRDGADNGNPGAQAPQMGAQPRFFTGGDYRTDNAVPAAVPPPQPAGAWLHMVQAKRWLLRKADKQPFYVNGTPRGKPDTPEDRQRLATYAEAQAALAATGDRFAGLGFALGPDERGGFWQGIDLDKVQANGLSDLANQWVGGDLQTWGYVERSPSGVGLHIIGYGVEFKALGPNQSGIEAYSSGRYFTVTGHREAEGQICDLAPYVAQVLAPRHGKLPAASGGVEVIPVPPETVTDLRSALMFMRSDDYDIWYRMGLALKELGEQGRGLWLEWSSTSHKFNAAEASRKWDGFAPDRTGYQAVFAEAQRLGWVNPRSKVAQMPAVVLGDFQSRTPRNFLKTASAPALDLANMPRPIADFAHAFSAAHGFDRSGVVMAAIAATAAMIDDGYVLEAKSGWYVSARLWTVLIGRSATGKSRTIKAATSPVKNKHSELLAYFAQSYQPDPDKPGDRPPEPALYTSDTTIEALSEKLRHNPRGMLMLTEEFSSWIGSIDASNKGEAAKNRGAWLQLYDGGPYQIDRIGRRSFQVQNWGASVLTATTPTALADHMKHLPEDGLIQRFIPVILSPRDFNAEGDARAALHLWNQWLNWIFDKTHPEKVQFSPDAARLFKMTESELGRCAAAMDDLSPALASHIGKHSEMVARMALVFQTFENTSGRVLELPTLQMAVNLMAQLRKHSVALYTDVLGRSPATDIARALARSLAADSSLQAVGRDWMTQHCRAFAQARDDRVRREAVQLLEDLDWLKDVSARTYGGWPTKWEVNQNIFRLYAREGEEHRSQRAAVQAIFDHQPEG